MTGDPGGGGQGLEHCARAVGKDQSRARPQTRQRRRRVGVGGQVEIGIQQAVASRAGEVQAQGLRGVVQRVCRHGGEILAPLHRTLHQTLQPGVFELLRAPEIRQRRAAAGKKALDRRRDRLRVEQRSIRVENQRID